MISCHGMDAMTMTMSILVMKLFSMIFVMTSLSWIFLDYFRALAMSLEAYFDSWFGYS
jgi:hypothetical protein